MGVFWKDGAWWIDYYLHGCRRRQRMGLDKSFARRKLLEVRHKIADKKMVIEPRISFLEMFDRFLKEHSINKKDSGRDEIVKRHFKNFLAESLHRQDIPLKFVNAEFVDRINEF